MGTKGAVHVRSALLLVVPALALLLHARVYYPFLADDALISLRYSERLANGLGLTWSDGERVEGYSNLSWVVACSLLNVAGVDLVFAARALGVIGMGGALACLAPWTRVRDFKSGSAAAIAAGAFALTGPIAVWLVGGLEQPFVALFLALGLAGVAPFARAEADRPNAYAGPALAALCLSRPDGALLAVLVLVGSMLARGLGLRALRRRFGIWLRLSAWPALAVLGQLAFRIAYYRDFVPNTARAKVAFSVLRLRSGLDYAESAALELWPLVALAALGLVLGGPRRREHALTLLPLAGWVFYVVFVGGDIFPAWRHFVPVVVLLTFTAARGVALALARAPTRRSLAVCAGAACLLFLQASSTFASADTQDAADERWEWDGMLVGELLHDAFTTEAPLLAVDPAGAIPFFSKLPTIDMLGLNDRWLGHHPPADLGSGHLGHELGNGRYVFEREPDLVVLCMVDGHAGKPCFRGGVELTGQPGFHDRYALERFRAHGEHDFVSTIWVRRAGRVGIRRTRERQIVPGHMLATDQGFAEFSGGRFGATLPAGSEVVLPLLEACTDCSVALEAAGVGTATLRSPRELAVTAVGPLHVRSVRLDYKR